MQPTKVTLQGLERRAGPGRPRRKIFPKRRVYSIVLTTAEESRKMKTDKRKLAFASVVTHMLVKGKLRRQVLENSCYKEEQRNRLAVAS